MNETVIYLSIGVLALIIGFIFGKLLSKGAFESVKTSLENTERQLSETKQTTTQTIQQLKQEQKDIQLEKEDILRVNIRQDEAIKTLQEKLTNQKEDVANLQEKFKNDFEVLANKILEEKSSKFTEQNKENLKSILDPLQKNIEKFEKKVEDSHKESIDRHAALRQQIIGLKELNAQMSKETINLTKALKGDSKTQGNWGETQLEMILEKANMTKGIHYSTQGGYRDDEGKLKKPDFIINLPDKRHLIIDAKVSLTSYEAYYSSENNDEKEVFLKKHLNSIKKHIKELSEKKYSSLYNINSPDYVLMFVPVEAAFILALNKNNNLYLDALDKNIVLVSTSTLLATLSTVSSMWKHENQKKNVLQIAEQAGRLYDQFVNLTDDLIKVGNQLKTVQGSYDNTMKKLTGKGNLIKKVENIKNLGITTSKSIKKNLLERANEED